MFMEHGRCSLNHRKLGTKEEERVIIKSGYSIINRDIVPEDDNIICEDCKYECKSPFGYMRHIAEKCRERDFSYCIDCCQISDSKFEEIGGNFCVTTESTTHSRKIYFILENKDDALKCYRFFVKNWLIKHKREECERTCTECGVVCIGKKKLEHHKYHKCKTKCPECSKFFTGQQGVNQHSSHKHKLT